MMGAEGFGSDSFNDAGEMISGTGGGSNTLGFNVSQQGFLRRGMNDPKQMLEIGKEPDKLKAMKQIISDMAQGHDQSDLFPSVVKCVASKSLEVKKLVYMYLVRYAEDLPDLALLSISTFQKGLSDPNQLIRASALRVLSSIRVPVIVPIMQIALKQAASDMSPYVRKTAAHALPKLYQLAPAEMDNVMEVLERLLHDRTTMVLGSVIMAFEEICPDRLDLVHRHFRKLCNTLIDIDEWGQVAIIHLLTRYSRTQFLDPNAGSEPLVEGDMPFYDDDRKEEEEEEEDDDSDDDSEGDSEGKKKKKKRANVMDPDHRLFLRSLLPLLHSRNAGVVMAVVQAYHYLAPHSEVPQVARAMIRLVKSHRETQYIVLTAIASMASDRKGMFEPYIKSLFVRASDPQFVRLLKLEILTTLANESNISPILREFQEYVKHSDREFVTQTVQCIGRCASRLKNVTESCLQGLMALMNNKDEAIVAESVVVIKKLLQLNPEAHKEIIIMMSKMANKVTVPMAKASVLWIIGEYSSHVPKIAPDVLRQMAQTFPQEEAIVKLQVLNLAAKLYIVNTKQTKLLVSYVLNLAKYDLNYDLRDRARLIRAIILTKDTKLHKKAKKFFLSEKPAPNLRSTFSDRDRFQVGTMSHVLNKECAGWKPLPEFPEDMPDPSVREVVEEKSWEAEEKSKASFFSETSSSGSDSESDSDTDSSGSGSDSDSSDSEDGTSTDTDTDATAEAAGAGKTKVRRRKAETSSEEENSFDSTSSDSGSDDDDNSDSDEDDTAEQIAIAKGEESPDDPPPATAASATADSSTAGADVSSDAEPSTDTVADDLAGLSLGGDSGQAQAGEEDEDDDADDAEEGVNNEGATTDEAGAEVSERGIEGGEEVEEVSTGGEADTEAPTA